MSMRDLTFNGVSLRSLGGRITEKPYHTIAKRRVEREKIYGKSGDDFIDSGSYENVDFSVKIALLPYTRGQTAQQAARAVIDWLAPLQNAYYEYRDTENSGYFTQAVLTNFNQIERELRTMLTATLQFSRMPYWYSDAGTTETEFINGAAANTLTNPERYDSEPVYRFNTSREYAEDVTITVNGASVTFSTSKREGNYYFDNVQGQFYYLENGVKTYLSVQSSSARSLPNLSPGANTLSFSQNGLSSGSFELFVKPNWRRL